MKRNVIWVEKDVNDKDYVEHIERLKGELLIKRVETFTSANKAISYLRKTKELKYGLCYVIMGESVADKFIEQYAESVYTMCIICINILFIPKVSEFKRTYWTNDLFLNPGGVTGDFGDIISYIKRAEDQLWTSFMNYPDKNDPVECKRPPPRSLQNAVFEPITSQAQLYLPIRIMNFINRGDMVERLVNEYGREEDVNKMVEFIYSFRKEYRGCKNCDEICSLLKPSQDKLVLLPLGLLALFWIKLYTCEDPAFYNDINARLASGADMDIYKPYVLLMYCGIKATFPKYCKKLYRLDEMKQEEYDSLYEYMKDKIEAEKAKKEKGKKPKADTSPSADKKINEEKNDHELPKDEKNNNELPKEEKNNNELPKEEKNNAEQGKTDSTKPAKEEENHPSSKDDDKDELPTCIMYFRPFTLFSKEKMTAKKFAARPPSKHIPVLYVIKKLDGEPENFSVMNIDVDELKLYDNPKEKQVLILPYACFEVHSVKDKMFGGTLVKKITLTYLKKYDEKITEEMREITDTGEGNKYIGQIMDTRYFADFSRAFRMDNLNDIIRIYALSACPVPELLSDEPIEFDVSYYASVTDIVDVIGPSANTVQSHVYSKGLKHAPILINSNAAPINVHHMAKDTTNSLVTSSASNTLSTSASNSINSSAGNTITNSAGNTLTTSASNVAGSKHAKVTAGMLDQSACFQVSNIAGDIIGSTLANIDTLAENPKQLGIQTGLTVSASAAFYAYASIGEAAGPIGATALFGGFLGYDIYTISKSKAYTTKERARGITTSVMIASAGVGTGLGGYYIGTAVAISLGVITGPGVIAIGVMGGTIGGLGYGLIARYFSKSPLVITSASAHGQYIPEKYRVTGRNPPLEWNNVDRSTKSFVLEAVENDSFCNWLILNIPPTERGYKESITPEGPGSVIRDYIGISSRAVKVEFRLYALNRDTITAAEWRDPRIQQEITLEFACLEINKFQRN